ncbi:MAG: glycosyltransferase [Verrucomicrobiae bacterium]|nr:glycosyltransferase [Verrucomicrobiae bacterium]
MINSEEASLYPGKPEITLLIALYRSEAFIERTLQSIQSQTLENFVCIIGDDLSPDNAFSIAWDFATRDRRFRVYRNEQNLGWIENVNRLLSQVETPFYMIMPHDDVLAPSYLEETHRALLEDPQAVVSFSDISNHYQNGRVVQSAYDVEVSGEQVAKRAIRFLRGGGSWWLPYRGLVKTSLAGNRLRLRKSMAGEAYADLPWIFTLTLRGNFVRIPNLLYHKYIYDTSASNNWGCTLWQHIAAIFSCMRCLLTQPVKLWDKLIILSVLHLKVIGPFIYLAGQQLFGKKTESIEH